MPKYNSVSFLGYSEDLEWQYVLVPEGEALDEKYIYESPEDGEPIYRKEQTPSQRKIVISTNIAETSLTIEGINIVVDSGLAREPVFDPRTGMTRLQTGRISKASSIQRMGRAGRLGPGTCYRLWSEQQQQQLAAHTTPEILQADLAPLVLQMLAWGIDDPMELQWLDPPPTAPFHQARELLELFGAVSQTASGGWQLTTHGERMAAMPAHPRLAHMLMVGIEHGLTTLACQLAALLSERDPLSANGVDLSRRLAVLDGDGRCPANLKGWRHRVLQQAKRFAALCKSLADKPVVSFENAELDRHDGLALLVASAYPDRIARQRDAGSSYQLSNGRTANLPQHDSLVTTQWLAVAELGGQVGKAEDVIYSAAGFSPELLEGPLKPLLSEFEAVHWDNRSEQFIAERRQHLGAIVLRRVAMDQIAPEAKAAALVEVVRKRGLQLLPWDKPLQQWRGRVQLLHEHLGEPWPDVSDEALLGDLEQWLAPYLEPVNRLSDFQKLDLGAILEALLPWPLPRQLDELAPRRLAVPSGSTIEVDYCQAPPVLAVKLQEMFGCQQTPAIANGKVELTVHLLSPARRPLQITRDLAGFWRNSYEQVKKEMKGRYPKHPWPDNPLQALPTRHTKKRQAGK